MNRKSLVLMGALVVCASMVAPNAMAHFANNFQTHEHPFLRPGGVGAGNFAQRLCVNTTTLTVIPSDVNGVCPPGFTPVPLLRGLRSGALLDIFGCSDFTIPQNSLIETVVSPLYPAWVGGIYSRAAASAYSGEKSNPHDGTPGPHDVPSTTPPGTYGFGPFAGTNIHNAIVTDSADGSNWFESDDVNQRPALSGEYGQPDYIYSLIPPIASVGPSNAANNRYASYPGGAAAQTGAQTSLHDTQDPDEAPETAAVVSNDPPGINQLGSPTDGPGVNEDYTDNDFESSDGIAACHTYAIDSNPDAWAAPAGITPAVIPEPECAVLARAGSTHINGGAVPISSGCRNGGVTGLSPTHAGSTLYPCIGEDLNDPVISANRPSGPWLPSATLFEPETTAHPIGGDAQFDLGEVGAAPLGPVVQFNGGGANGKVAGIIPTYPAAGPAPSGCGAAVYSGAGDSSVVGDGSNVVQFDNGVNGPEGILIAVPTPATQTDFLYGVCNDVAGNGCTNIPTTLTSPQHSASPIPGVVWANLQQCIWHGPINANPQTARVYVNPISATVRSYYGRAADWGVGTPIKRPIGAGGGDENCWPEDLGTTFGGALWVPHSQSNVGGTYTTNRMPGLWIPDDLPPTPRAREILLVSVDAVEANVLAGTCVVPNPPQCPPNVSAGIFFAPGPAVQGWVGVFVP